VAEALLGHEVLEPVAALALADEQEPRLGQPGEEPLEAVQQQLVAAVGGEAGDGDDDG
jgi:hypothetical protein